MQPRRVDAPVSSLDECREGTGKNHVSYQRKNLCRDRQSAFHYRRPHAEISGWRATTAWVNSRIDGKSRAGSEPHQGAARGGSLERLRRNQKSSQRHSRSPRSSPTGRTRSPHKSRSLCGHSSRGKSSRGGKVMENIPQRCPACEFERQHPGAKLSEGHLAGTIEHPEGNWEFVPATGTGHVKIVSGTLRDYFAAKAMQAWLSTYGEGVRHPSAHPTGANQPTAEEKLHIVAKQAYSIADAMLKVRED